VEGTLGQDDLEYWSFSGRAGDQITILMQSRQVDSFLALFGPDDKYLIVDDDSGGDLDAMIRRFVLPDSGIYNIVATSYGGYGSGGYTLELERTDSGREPGEIGGGTIAVGDVVNGELQEWTGDAWLFTGSAGERLTISLESDDFDTVLEIWGPDLSLIEDDDDSGWELNSLIEDFALPTSGTYNIVVHGFSRGERGSYTLSLD
jgi:hypothetical protein